MSPLHAGPFVTLLHTSIESILISMSPRVAYFGLPNDMAGYLKFPQKKSLFDNSVAHDRWRNQIS